MKKNAVIIKKPTGLMGISILKGIHIQHEFEKHIHNIYCVGLITSGKRLFTIQNTEYLLQKNDMYICNPDDVHTCSSVDGKDNSYLVLCIAPELIQSINASNDKPLYRTRFTNIFPKESCIHIEFKKLCRLLESDSMILRKEEQFYSFVEKLCCEFEDKEKTQKTESDLSKCRILEIKDFIQNHCTSDFLLADISSMFEFSPFYINRMFKKEIGISLHCYQIQMRIEKSRKLLAEGLSISDAAVSSGFTDQSHFHRFFKKYVGVTPGIYAAHNRKDNFNSQ